MNIEVKNPIIQESESHYIRQIKSFEGAKYFGKKRGWCTDKENWYYGSYSSKHGKLYNFFEKGKSRSKAQLFLSHNGSSEFKLKHNAISNLRTYLESDKILLEWIYKEIFKRELTDKQIIKGKFDQNRWILNPRSFHHRINLPVIGSSYLQPVEDYDLTQTSFEVISFTNLIELVIETDQPINIHHDDLEEMNGIMEFEQNHPIEYIRSQYPIFIVQESSRIYLNLGTLIGFHVKRYSSEPCESRRGMKTTIEILFNEEDKENIEAILGHYRVIGGDVINRDDYNRQQFFERERRYSRL